MVQSNDISMTLDPEIRDALDAYAKLLIAPMWNRNSTQHANSMILLIFQFSSSL